MSNFSVLCLDLAGLRPAERRFLRLYAEYGLTPGDIAEVYDTTSARVKHVLKNARQKYDQYYRRIKWS